MGPETPNSIPGVADDELVSAAKTLASAPPAIDDESERFAEQIRAIAEARSQSGWAGEATSDLAVFVSTRYPRKAGEKFSAKPVADLIATKRPIFGNVFFLNSDASYGRVIEIPTDPEEIIDWLVDNGFGDEVAVFVYRSTSLMLVRAKGVRFGPTAREKVRDKQPVATVVQIGDALAHLHMETLATPNSCPNGVWEDGCAAQYVPGQRPEKAIQEEVARALRSWFRGVLRASIEEPIPPGRIDVKLLQQQENGKWAYWAIIELKVIKSWHNAPKGSKPTAVSPADNVAAVVKGVQQASAFGKYWNSEALLEVFDLRKDKTADVLATELVVAELQARSPVPNCRVWQLFGSASDARMAGFVWD